MINLREIIGNKVSSTSTGPQDKVLSDDIVWTNGKPLETGIKSLVPLGQLRE
jgi:hypothetical protein